MKYVNYDRISDVYDETRSIPEELIGFFKEKVHNFLSTKLGKPPYNILSIGIGTGRIESYLSSKNHSLFGVDISSKMLRKLTEKKLNPTSYPMIADGYSIPLRKSIHIISLIHLLHFIEDFESFFSELNEISKFLVVGNAYSDAHLHPYYIHFREILVEKGIIEQRKDVPILIKFKEFMKEKGYSAVEKIKEIPVQLSSEDILLSIRRRYFSSFWDIEDNLFANALSQLHDYIEKNEKKTENYFLAKSAVRLYFYDLN